MKRIITFSLVTAIGFIGPVWLFAFVGAAYAFWTGGLEIIILCAGIDALFMTTQNIVPVFTLLSIAVLLISEFVKPYLFVYN